MCAVRDYRSTYPSPCLKAPRMEDLGFFPTDGACLLAGAGTVMAGWAEGAGGSRKKLMDSAPLEGR